ncbi:MAG TPA: 2-hydroxyacyl-CoA dehydratase family protein [Sedimentisphaerales bacterium]|nr:2-hydroxyacyl-CoA dehydratase family protein [Sedimentisphaerales bacterium]
MTKTVVYVCPYVPAEWVAAHGLHPSRITPRAAGLAGAVGRIEGVCPYVRGFINEVITSTEACAVLVTTVCDQMRRAFDVIARRSGAPVFLMNVANTWQNVAVQKLYIDELKRLGRFLAALGGEAPSTEALAEIMLKYDTARKSMLAARDYLTSRQYSQMIAEFGRGCDCDIAKGVTGSKLIANNGVPLAVIGGPLLKEDFGLFDTVEDAGGRIVLDATETGERGLCAAFDRRRVRDEPVIELCEAYFMGIADASRRPNSRLYDWLGRELASRGARGIIFRRYVWCDIWHAELRRLQEWSNLPVLDIDVTGDEQCLPVRTAHRIRTFLEMLQ